jgi:2-polyprenyl-3-methyl-5-hydroxy-6-metoxy-1,4-benzoquinol methylase
VQDEIRPETLNVTELVQKVRDQIIRKHQATESPSQGTNTTTTVRRLSAKSLENLRSTAEELRNLETLFQAGEPHPPALTLRGRLGFFLKKRLHRLLWWHTYQIGNVASLLARYSREELNALEFVSQSASEGVGDLVKQVLESDPRLLQSIQELQRHVARLEYVKANRDESDSITTHYESLLVSKADRQECSDLSEKISRLEERMSSIGESAAQAVAERLSTMMDAQTERFQEMLQQLDARISICEQTHVEPKEVARIGEEVITTRRQLAFVRQDLQDNRRRLGVFLEQARRRMPEPFTSEQLTELTLRGQDSLDSLYVAFEDRFRGSPDSVRDGLVVYLPYIQQALQRTGGGSVIDVGCGRGEWLDLLRRENIQGRGVDLNAAAIELCREQGLEVTLDDGVSFLRGQLRDSSAAITSFHLIEHLDFRSWVALIDEALRILKPGGVAIFETPNVRNILTAAGDFYRDPTHQRPIFPETIEAIAEMRGFLNSKAYCFNKDRTELIPLADHPFDTLDDYVSISRDFVWVGIKEA